MSKVLLPLLFVLIRFFTLAQSKNDYIPAFISDQEHTLHYRYLPPNHLYPDSAKTRKYPVVLFLHGSGERGDDNFKQLVHGGDFFAQNNVGETAAHIIYPQCPENIRWSNVVWSDSLHTTDSIPTWPMHLVMALLDSFLLRDDVDPSRIYLCGLSMGGYGTWDLAVRWPHAAAIAEQCGGGDAQRVQSIAHIPCMLFHGAKDTVVPLSNSLILSRSLRKAGGQPIVVVYPELGHNTWDYVFTNNEWLHWLFQQKKS